MNRESSKYYISASDTDIYAMLSNLGLKNLEDLFFDIDPNLKHTANFTETPYENLRTTINNIANKNKLFPSFIGDSVTDFKVSDIVKRVASLRGLSTPYTPYQPEASQGTLISLYLYSSLMHSLTGFEAISSSLYDRSTAIFEAITTAIRISEKKKILVCDIHPSDKQVVLTLSKEREIDLEFISLTDKYTCNLDTVTKNIKDAAAVVFNQVNSLGFLEDVDSIYNICQQNNVLAISVVDPILLSVLNTPDNFSDIMVGEGQNLAAPPSFGGPGLGIFGIRYNSLQKGNIRNIPGRLVGKTTNTKGEDAYCMVLSTREQHIRREKATSNICSNQAFMATLAAANILVCGNSFKEMVLSAHKKLVSFLEKILTLDGVELAASTPFVNQVSLKLNTNVKHLIDQAFENSLYLGVDVSDRFNNGNNYLLISFFSQTDKDIKALEDFFCKSFPKNSNKKIVIPTIPDNNLRKNDFKISKFSEDEVFDYFKKLSALNFSPDDFLYPLGSCTMKYNPLINDEMAATDKFRLLHPQVSTLGAQGSLEILYLIQELFKKITGLDAVTTQPVAGAQSELVGIKLFQAYFRDKGETRNILLIPSSAHGTNPATATMAGAIPTLVNVDKSGMIDLDHLNTLIENHKSKLLGIMITNPNTSGILEHNFSKIAKIIHDAGGLVFMDGANLNAIAGQIDLKKLGVDAVHNNLHKTWSLAHGGGGPGDAIVATTEKLAPFLPGVQIIKDADIFKITYPAKSIGSIHRNFGNFLNKIRCLTYLLALGSNGIRKMSSVAVLSSRYLFKNLLTSFEPLPKNKEINRMHEFILTLSDEEFKELENLGLQKVKAIIQLGKLFLDFNMHAPTVAFPEVLGIMIEPTESYTKNELDSFLEIMFYIKKIIKEDKQILINAPHFTYSTKIDEVKANRDLTLFDTEITLPKIRPHSFAVKTPKEIYEALKVLYKKNR